MKNIIEIVKNKRWIHYLIISLIGIAVCIPLFWIQIRHTDDGWLHLIRLIGLDKSMAESNFPYLVAPYICRDFGYSMMSLYPPIVAYLPFVFSFIAGSFAGGLKVFAALSMAASGIFMYNFVHEVTKNKGISFLAAIIYIIFPYRFEVIFDRFAIGEFTAFIFIPIVLQGLYNLLKGDKKKHFYLTIGAVGLLLSHTISTLYTAIFCVILIIFNYRSFFKKEVILKCIINVIFILLISALFLIPLLEYKSQAVYSIFMPNVMRTSGEYTKDKGIEPVQFLKDLEEDGVSFVVGIPILTMLMLGLLAYKHIDKKYKTFYITFLILGAFSAFMCTKYFPWYYMPNILNTIQYPWRMLGFALFFLSPICAINIISLLKCLKQEKNRMIVLIGILVFTGIFTGIKLSHYYVKENNIDNLYESNLKNDLKISHFSVNRDYLPYNALIRQFGYTNEREDRIYILSGDVSVYDEQKSGLNFSCYLLEGIEGTNIELPYIFYPGYTVILKEKDNSKILNTFESDNGFLTIQLPQDINKAYLTVEYTGTTLEKASYCISAISLIGFIGYIIYSKKQEKKEEKE